VTPQVDGAGAEHPRSPTAAETYPAHRLNALCDGVFAIAMTLLALEIRIPDAGDDPVRFRSLLPEFAGQLGLYALGFVIIGRFWQSHHRLGVHVHHVDQVAIRRTIALLAGVSALPVATALLVRDGQFPEAVAVAAGLMTLTGLLSLWLYRRLARPELSDLDPGTRAHLLRRGALSTLVLALALPLAYLLPDSSYAPLVWWALLLVEPAARGLGRRSASRHRPLVPRSALGHLRVERTVR
jgi:uncharacterized membrane protein